MLKNYIDIQIADLAASTSTTVVWRPTAEPGSGYVTTWEDAVTAVNLLSGPTYIQIYANPDSDTVIIPGGTWTLNNTTIVGKAIGADTDTDYRGWQELLYVVTAGDQSNPTCIKGCVGLKDMFFRATDFQWELQSNGGTGSITAFDSTNVTFTKSDGAPFTSLDIGKPLRIGQIAPYGSWGSDVNVAGNRGTFYITAVIDSNTVQYINVSADISDVNNGSISWSKCTSIFITDASQGDGSPINYTTEFTLDNVDFRYGGDYNWGSFYIGYEASTFFHLKNGASIRWFSTIVDGRLVIQTDGAPSWVGSLAFAGNGHVDVFPMAGTQVRTWQVAISSWTLHQSYTMYLPTNTDHWDSSPTTIMNGLDYLAETRLRSSQNLSDLSDISVARNNLGLGDAATHAASDFDTSAAKGFIQYAPSSPGATAGANPKTNILINAAGCSPGIITTSVTNGTNDGDEIQFQAGPWGLGVTWIVTPTSQAFQSGTGLTFTGLAGVVIVKWSTDMNAWLIKSMYGLVSVT